jgi:hypothetical protein
MSSEIKKSWQRPPTMPQTVGFVPGQLDRSTMTRHGLLWSAARNEPITHLDLLNDGTWRWRQVVGGGDFGGNLPCLSPCTVDEAKQFLNSYYPTELPFYF